MACAVASVSAVAVPAAVAQLGESSIVSRRSVSLAAPKSGFSTKVACKKSRVVMSAAPRKEYNVAGLTAMALLAATVIPEIAEAAQPGITPSLKNLLISVIAGGVIAGGIGIVVAGVSTFDPVKRR